MQHIVLVDDQAANLRAHARMLGTMPDVAIHPFRSSADALAWAGSNDADCFIIDLKMPAPDGIEMTRLLRRRAASELTPIIMVTAIQQREARYAALDAGVNDFIEKPADPREFVARVGTLLELSQARKQLRARVDDLMTSLDNEERRARDHAARMETLWRIATNPRLDDGDMLQAVLDHSASAIRPNERFVARLFRLDGEDAVLDATSDTVEETIGARKPIAKTLLRDLSESGPAVVCDDRHHCEIHAPLRAGGVDYALTYTAATPESRPFDSDDLLYVTIVTAFLQARFQQRWQAERIAYQMQYDLLTGLINRTRFRAAVREIVERSGSCAVAFIDLVDFHEVNRIHGNLTGDALLVEVGAALRAAASPHELVARIAGDTFAVCFPGPIDDRAVAERLDGFRAVFETPFSTGDRAGTEFVHLDARIGVASADPARSLNDLMTRAEMAVDACRHREQSRLVVD